MMLPKYSLPKSYDMQADASRVAISNNMSWCQKIDMCVYCDSTHQASASYSNGTGNCHAIL